jgi:acyl carrier protein
VSDLEARALDLLSEICKVPREALTPQAVLITDLNVDSVVTLDLLIALEENFAIDISVVAASKLQTVGDVLAYVRTHAVS